MSNELDTQSLLIELMGPIVYVQLHYEQPARWQALAPMSVGSFCENELDKDEVTWRMKYLWWWLFLLSSWLYNTILLLVFFFPPPPFFHPSLVFPLDLCVMYLYVHCDRVNTSTVTTSAYDSDDKWMETHSGRLQDCLQCDIEASLLSRSQNTSLEGLPSQITPSDIFFSSFSALPKLFFFHLAGLLL